MARSRYGTNIFILRPIFSVPFPGIVEQRRGAARASKQDDATSSGVKYHRDIRTCWRSDILFLRPQKLRHGAEPKPSDFRAQAVFRNPQKPPCGEASRLIVKWWCD